MSNLIKDDKFGQLILGKAMEEEPYFLTSKFFPSKIGGKPAWLSLKNIPSIKSILCKKCNTQRIFLMQVYAENDKECCFHRTLFIFVCKSEKCNSNGEHGSFVVFRSQLAQVNDFYSTEPPNSEDEEEEECNEDKSKPTVCHLCGIYTNRKSPSSNNYYCTAEHQHIHQRMQKKKSTGD